MGIEYKIDVLARLKEKGWSAYKLGHEKQLSETTIQRLRRGEIVEMKSIEKICKLLELQPGEIITYVPDSISDSGGAISPDLAVEFAKENLKQYRDFCNAQSQKK